MNTTTPVAPALYIPHGGGPLPVMGDSNHTELISFLKSVPDQMPTPAAILVVSAHWENSTTSIMSAANPSMHYDYSGFPAETYKYHYPAPGSPAIAAEIMQELQKAKFDCQLDESRDYDHGLFIPLMLMYSKAEIPCLQVSLQNNLDAGSHIKLGQILASLRKQNVLILGSGMSFHNFSAFFDPTLGDGTESDQFQDWILDVCVRGDAPLQDRIDRMADWQSAPCARFCHPREEHLLPLHVCFGAGIETSQTAEIVFDSKILGKRVVGLMWR